MKRMVMFFLSAICLTACDLDISDKVEDRYLGVIQKRFDSEFKINFDSESKTFELLPVDAELNSQITDMLIGSGDSSWKDLTDLIIDLADGTSDVLGEGYTINLLNPYNTEKSLIIATHESLLYTVADERDAQHSFSAGKLNVSPEDVIEATSSLTDFTILNTFDFGDDKRVTIANSKSDDISFFSFYELDNDFPTAMFFRISDDAYWSVKNLAQDCQSKLLNLVGSKVRETSDYGKLEIKDYRLYGIIFNYEISPDELTFTLADIAPTDFFASEERAKQYLDLYYAGDFEALYQFTSDHLERGDVSEIDSAHLILNNLKPIMKLIDQIEIVPEYSSITERTYGQIYYKGLTEVNDEHLFVPYAHTGNNLLYITTGFKPSVINEEPTVREITFDLDDKEKIVFSRYARAEINDSGMEEESKMLEVGQLEQLLKAKQITVRFIGNNGQLHEHQLTKTEMDALELLSHFEKLYGIFSELYELWGEI